MDFYQGALNILFVCNLCSAYLLYTSSFLFIDLSFPFFLDANNDHPLVEGKFQPSAEIQAVCHRLASSLSLHSSSSKLHRLFIYLCWRVGKTACIFCVVKMRPWKISMYCLYILVSEYPNWSPRISRIIMF